MKVRTIFTVVLVGFVCVTAAYLVWDAARTRSAVRDAENKRAAIGTEGRDSSSAPSQVIADPAETAAPSDKPSLTASEQSEGSASDKAAGYVPRQSAGSSSGQSADAAANRQRLASGPSGARNPETTDSGLREDAAANSRLDKQTNVSMVSEKPGSSPAQRVVAYYFHGTKRCPTCLKMEAYADEAIKSGFGEAMKQGLLEWRVVNTDEPANKHFLSDYQLYTKALVIVKVQGGKQTEWKNLEKIWDLVGEKDDFVKYVQEEIGVYLGAKK